MPLARPIHVRNRDAPAALSLPRPNLPNGETKIHRVDPTIWRFASLARLLASAYMARDGSPAPCILKVVGSL
jgi:hypothetical protein